MHTEKKNKIWSLPLKYTWFPLNVVSAMCSKILMTKVQRHGGGHTIQDATHAVCRRQQSPEQALKDYLSGSARWRRKEVGGGSKVHTQTNLWCWGKTGYCEPWCCGRIPSTGGPQETSLLQRTEPGSRRA